MLAGLILAGGEGKRWGRPKAWAKLPDGRSFLEACARVLRNAGAQPVVATLPPGADDPRIGGLDVVVLPEPGMDMFGSLRAGLGHLMDSDDWEKLAVLPVDHPLVRAETVKALASANAVAVVPSYNRKHGHPICLSRQIVEQVIDGSFEGPTLRDVLRAVGAVDLPVDDPGVVANCNTPETLRAALGRMSS